MKLQKLLSYVRRAVDDYSMIEEGDKIAVGISGGKDSICLLVALKHLQRFYPKRFELEAITVSLGLPGASYDGIQALCNELGVHYTVVETDIGKIIFDERKEKNPCSLCAKLRKGALNQKIKELGCNKVAYAHHMDDMIETMVLSMIWRNSLAAIRSLWGIIRTMLWKPSLCLCFMRAGSTASLPLASWTEKNSIPSAR